MSSEFLVNEEENAQYLQDLESLSKDVLVQIAYTQAAHLRDLRKKVTSLEADCFHDFLTGAYNSRFSSQKIEELIDISQRTGEYNNYLLVIDVDNFKNINDTEGHAEGDKQLQLLVNFLHFIFRKTDFVVRQGGDEFVVIITNCLDTKALIRKIHSFPVHLENFDFKTTLSMGLIKLTDSVASLEEADILMYQSKNAQEKGRLSYYDYYKNLVKYEQIFFQKVD